MHAIGDRANREALDAFESTRDVWQPRGLRQRIEHAQCVAPRVVHRNVLVPLEKSHLANALRRNAASRDVRDGATRKFKTGVRDIDFVCQHRNADRFHFCDRLFDEREQNIEIVNHQVVDHVDVEAARSENTEAMDFEKERAIENWLDGDHRGIEAFDVADLQDAREFLCGSEESIGFGQIARHRFFDKDIETEFHQAAACGSVVDSRDGDARGVDVAAQIIERFECFGLKLGSDLGGTFGVFIVDAGKLCAR